MIGVGLLVGRLLNDLLFGIEPFDPVTFVGAPVVLGATALLAAYLCFGGRAMPHPYPRPRRRATRTPHAPSELASMQRRLVRYLRAQRRRYSRAARTGSGMDLRPDAGYAVTVIRCLTRATAYCRRRWRSTRALGGPPVYKGDIRASKTEIPADYHRARSRDRRRLSGVPQVPCHVQ